MVFTGHGVAILSSVLRSKKAIEINILTIAGGMNEEYGALVGSFGLGYLFSKIKVNKTVINQSPPKLVQTLSVNQINSLAESYNRKLYEKINNK